jgi:hypothetical protein
MNLLLFLFAIPFAVIIFSIILQKLINNPILVAFATFSIILLIAAITMDEIYYILAIVYTIVSYIAALLTRIIRHIIENCGNSLSQTNWSSQILHGNQSNVIDIDNEYNNKSDIIIEKNNMNRKCWK